MINNFKIKLVNSLGILTVCVLLCFSCEETILTETYEQYIPEDVVSIAKPDSVAVIASGYNKLTFKVFVNSDPKIKKAVIAFFDDDVTDEDDKVVATIDISRTTYEPEVYEVEVDIEEGGNEFFVHLEDAEGGESIKYDVFGSALGDEYVQNLLARQYTSMAQYSETEAIIYWESNRDATNVDEVLDELLVKTEITYTSDVDGSELVIIVDESEEYTIIPDFISEGIFTYTTFYRLTADSDIVFESEPTEGTFPTKI